MSVPKKWHYSSKKNSKHKTREIEIEKMWHRITKIIPVIVGALGMINKSTDQNF